MTNKYKLLLDAAKLMRSLADVVEAIAETYNDTVLNMWLAVFADVGVMILAVINAIRALFVKNL